jgi:hypothetical protein
LPEFSSTKHGRKVLNKMGRLPASLPLFSRLGMEAAEIVKAY